MYSCVAELNSIIIRMNIDPDSSIDYEMLCIVKPSWCHSLKGYRLLFTGNVRMYPYKHFSYNIPGSGVSIVTSIYDSEKYYADLVVRGNVVLKDFIRVDKLGGRYSVQFGKYKLA